MESDWFTWPIVAIIVLALVCAVTFIIKAIVKTSAIVREMDTLSTQLLSKDEVSCDELTEYGQSWARANLSTVLQGDKLIIEKQGGLYLTRAPLYQILIPEFKSPGRSAPALLTSLGVTGTFLGITLGLAGFNIQDVGQDSSSLITSAVVLLDGMKTAFYTSLAGLGSSVIFMIYMQYANRSQNQKIDKVNNKLSQVLREESATNYLKQLVELNHKQDNTDVQQQSAASMLALSQNLGSFMEQLQGVTQSLSGDGMAERISSSVGQAMKESVVPVLSEFKNELTIFREIKEENQQQLLNSLIGTIKEELIVPVTEELSKTTAAVTANTQVSEKLNENVAQVLSEVARTVETIDSFNQSTMQQLQAFAQQLSTVLTGFKDDTQSTMHAITTKVEDVLNISIQGMEAQRTAFDGSAERATLAFEGMGDKLEEALNLRAQSESALFGEMETRIQALLHSTSANFDRQTDILEKTGQEAGQLMQSAREELERGLGDIDTKVLSMSKTVQSELESFRTQYQENMTNFFNDQNNLLEDTLGKQRNNLVEVVDKFKQVFEEEYQTRHTLLQELTAQHEQLQKSARTIEQLAKAIGLTETATMSQLQDVANTIGRHVGDLKKEYIQASSAFKEVTEGLPKAMEKYFTHANQSTELFFQNFDEASSKIHNRLAQAADFLVDARLQDMSYDKAAAL
ncbi:hypothetical protein [Oceanisphaera sp. IT1-181]|uniref:hypothetical protein n=1 Tax=Oceanisphaera sp. IT1-181 TaxID=3081199 RepID=UPI0029CA1685|nr:hypothetical protein [Oceanisphaera sp. IT1-181]